MVSTCRCYFLTGNRYVPMDMGIYCVCIGGADLISWGWVFLRKVAGGFKPDWNTTSSGTYFSCSKPDR